MGKVKKYVFENGEGRLSELTAEEIAAMEAIPVLPQEYSVQEASVTALRCLLAGSTPTTADERIQCAALYPEWTAGAHTQGEIYTTQDQVWECYQPYDNAVHPDITPDSAAWYTFNRPLHGTSPETARYYVAPTGAHDMYHAGEYMIYTDGKLYVCKQDTAYSPSDYAAAWEKK